MIKLGDKVKDNITGLTGVVVARAEYLYDNPSVAIQAQALKDGVPIPLQWVNESRVEVVSE